MPAHFVVCRIFISMKLFIRELFGYRRMLSKEKRIFSVLWEYFAWRVNSHGHGFREKRHSKRRVSYITLLVRNIVNLRNCQIAIKMYSKAKFRSF